MLDMYDFYKNPPTTKRELREWLVSWLKPPIEPVVLEHNGEWFRVEVGFRRSGYSHTIYRSLNTGEYLWWVTQDGNMAEFPIKRSDTYEHLLNDIIDDYYVSWKLAG